MKSLIARYRLKEGVFISLFFPAAFALSDSSHTRTLLHFISAFLIIFGQWCMNFGLVDFRSARRPLPVGYQRLPYGRILLSYVLSMVIYVGVGLLLDLTGKLLSTTRGNWGHDFSSWFFIFLQVFLFNTLILLIKHAFDSNAEKRDIALENEALKQAHLLAEHETLKQQVSPHFLFNSLNTLRSLTKHDPQQAIAFIGELASVYRYLLQHQDKPVVSVGEELDFVRSYLYLLQIRFGEAIQTAIEVPASALTQPMPPNTLQLLVENAVKHNTVSTKRPLHISIGVEGNYLAVQNNLQVKAEPTASSRLGLSNISRRYLLLTGKDIIIQQDPACFRVLLPI